MPEQTPSLSKYFRPAIALVAALLPTLALVIFALFHMANLAYVLFQAETATIDTQQGQAEIFFSADRRMLLIPGGCVNIEWNVAYIAEVYVFGEPQIGSGTRTFCLEQDRRFAMRVILPDRSEYSTHLDVEILLPVKSAMATWVALLLAMVALGLNSYLGLSRGISPARLVVNALIPIILALSAVLLLFARLSFREVWTLMDEIPVLVHMRPLSQSRLDRVQMGLALVGLGLGVLALVMLLRRKYAENYLAHTEQSAVQVWRDLVKGFRTEECRGLLLFILVIGVFLRLYFIGQPISYDESFTYVYYASQPLKIGLTSYYWPNNHLFHTYLVHLTDTWFGGDIWAVRLPALLAGIFTIPAAYGVGRVFYNKTVGLLSAAFVATSPVLILYSASARGYSIVTFLFLLLLLTVASLLRRRENTFLWLLFALAAALGFYTLPMMVYPFGIVGIWIALTAFLQRRKREIWVSFAVYTALAGVLTVLLYTPVFTVSGSMAVTDNDFVKRLSWGEFGESAGPFAEKLVEDWFSSYDGALRLAVALLVGVGLAAQRKISRYPLPVLLAAVLWCVPVLLYRRNFGFERVWLFLLPVVWLTAAAGLTYMLDMLFDWIQARRFSAGRRVFVTGSVIMGVTAVLFVMMLARADRSTGLLYEQISTVENGEAAADFLAGKVQSGDKIEVFYSIPLLRSLEYYLTVADKQDYLSGSLENSRRIWLVIDNRTDALQIFKAANSHFLPAQFSAPQAIYRDDSISIYRYERLE